MATVNDLIKALKKLTPEQRKLDVMVYVHGSNDGNVCLDLRTDYMVEEVVDGYVDDEGTTPNAVILYSDGDVR